LVRSQTSGSEDFGSSSSSSSSVIDFLTLCHRLKVHLYSILYLSGYE
jgi:hypothetical protein